MQVHYTATTDCLLAFWRILPKEGLLLWPEHMGLTKMMIFGKQQDASIFHSPSLNLQKLVSSTDSRSNVLLEKFLELWIVWTATEEKGSSQDQSLSERVWRTRQIGIFFAKKDGFWTFLIFLAALSESYDYELFREENFRFCVGERMVGLPKIILFTI